MNIDYQKSPRLQQLRLLPVEALRAKRLVVWMDGFPRLLFETALAPLSVRKDNPSTTYVELISPPV
eukprot:4990846-Pyramimonas_sp.AAC.1